MGKESVYVCDDVYCVELEVGCFKGKKVEVLCFKGLGEMNL